MDTAGFLHHLTAQSEYSDQIAHIERMDNTDLDAIRKKTDPWHFFPGEMSRKSVAKRAYKWLPKDKLTGHLWVESFSPGHYYNEDATAFFLRWEFVYAF